MCYTLRKHCGYHGVPRQRTRTESANSIQVDWRPIGQFVVLFLLQNDSLVCQQILALHEFLYVWDGSNTRKAVKPWEHFIRAVGGEMFGPLPKASY